MPFAGMSILISTQGSHGAVSSHPVVYVLDSRIRESAIEEGAIFLIVMKDAVEAG